MSTISGGQRIKERKIIKCENKDRKFKWAGHRNPVEFQKLEKCAETMIFSVWTSNYS